MTQTIRWFLWLLGLGATVALLTLSAPRLARADGVPLPYGRGADIGMPGQKAIIVYDEEAEREDLILSIQLLSESSEAAWVVPVPSPPEVNTASAEWFVQLSGLTHPEIVTEAVRVQVEAPVVGMPGGVELLSREHVGVYDVSVLSSDEPGALLEWLNENGYTFPKEGEPILESYVEEGWYFMATRVLPGETAHLEGDVQPLWLSFDTAQPVYPMRLTALVDDYIEVLIYVLADHRMEIEAFWNHFDTEFAGELTLEPVASEESGLVDLLTGRPYYVTKLRNWGFDAQELPDDLYLRRASSDEPYRRVVHRKVYRPVARYPSCCSGLVPLGLVVGLGLVGRRHLFSRIAQE
jgi:hypothetical protein